MCGGTVYHWPNKREPDRQNCNVLLSLLYCNKRNCAHKRNWGDKKDCGDTEDCSDKICLSNKRTFGESTLSKVQAIYKDSSNCFISAFSFVDCSPILACYNAEATNHGTAHTITDLSQQAQTL
jgi:hypothetical protein